MANEIYPVSWWGSPVQNGWGGIYYDFAYPSAGDTTSFITTWRTTTTNETITIPTRAGETYNYDISTSDGQTFTGVSGNQTITFANAGDYDISVSGDFPQIFFNNGGDKLKIIDIKQWGVIAWNSFFKSFEGCLNLQLTATDAPDLSNVETLRTMFRNCRVLDANFNHWDVSNVTGMSQAFYGAFNFNSPLSNWDVSNVESLSFFARDTSFNQDLSSWNTSNLEDLNDAFNSTPYDGTGVSNWDVSGVDKMRRVFNASSFNQDISSWDIRKVTIFDGFLGGGVDTLTTSNYDAILIGWEATLQGTYPNGSGYTATPTISFGVSEYTGGGLAEAARTSLVSNFNWTITDGGIA